MRFLHTADWHLGRIFGGFDMLPVQQHALDGLVDIARDAGPQAIVVAGDVYDRAVPPEDAVHLLDDVLARLAEVAPVLLIAGNHDSGRRLEFGRGFLRRAGVHVAGIAGAGVERVDLGDRHGV
ncbi:MAG: exonuclease SbcCD subunit D, partial [Planctomycetia bacterium]